MKIKNLLKNFLFSAVFCLITFSGNAQDFVYKPVNPAFGGDTFNYSWLLNQAQIQDLITDPDAEANSLARNQLGIDDFTTSLNRQLLSQLSRELLTSQFGEDGLEDGQYTVGDFQIDVFTTIEGLTITITDNSIGEQTQIVIPFF